MMTCDRLNASAYRDGTLSSSEAVQFEEHLASCADCRRTLVEYARIGSAIKQLPIMPVPADLRRNVMVRLPDRRRTSLPWFSLSVASGVGLGVLILVGVFTRSGLPSNGGAALALATPTIAGSLTTGAPAESATPSSYLPPAATTTAAVATPTSRPASPTSAAAGTGAPATVTRAPASPTAPRPATPPVGTPAVAQRIGTPVTPSPTPAGLVRAPCSSAQGRFLALYNGDGAIRSELGCPVGNEIQATAVEALFQNGSMIRRTDTRQVYVVSDAGWFAVPDDEARGRPTFPPGTNPLPSAEVASQLLQLYRDNPAVRAALGSALAEVRSFLMSLQEFERGVMIGNERRMILVLYADQTWEIQLER